MSDFKEWLDNVLRVDPDFQDELEHEQDYARLEEIIKEMEQNKDNYQND